VQLRGIRPALASVALVAAPIAVLLATRPERPSTWSADRILRAACWACACACTAWLAITMVACVVAFLRFDAATAWRVAGGAPPFVRRALRTVFAGAVAVAPMTSHTAPPPVRVHVGPDGRLVQGRARNEATTSTSATTSTTTPPVSVPQPEPSAPRVRVARPQPRRETSEHAHVVRSGDNLWSISRTGIVRATGDPRPGDAIVAAYWQRVIALNRATLRSGNPSLIFPGEIVALPTP
jgi:nucleoid-associated protein YgaU